MKLKKYSQLFEADLKETLPEDYIRDVRRRAAPHMGGPTRQEFMEAMELMDGIFEIQEGREEELTQIGIDILKEHYGRMLEDIELDVKIVDKFDEEKIEMTKRMQSEEEQKEDEEEKEEKEEKKEPKYPSFEMPVNVPKEEIDRRKLVNNIMQGEAQNVHSMLYTAKDKIDAIDPALLDMYVRHLEINRKFDWDETRPDMSQWIKNHPEMANACETKYPKGEKDGEDGEEGGEEEQGDNKPKIIARVLDLPMIIHETVKAIYELMSHKAIPEDKTMAQALLGKTDTLKDEEEDIKYGPFIAADLRDYINDLLGRTQNQQTQTLPNLKEFIFSKMMDLNANVFVELMKNILTKEYGEADEIMKDHNIVKDAITDVKGEVEQPKGNYYSEEDLLGNEDDDTLDDEKGNELIDFFKKPTKPVAEEKPVEGKKKKWVEYGQGELMFMLNKAMDEGDWDTVKQIQPYIKEIK